jgi:hypothetical protein
MNALMPLLEKSKYSVYFRAKDALLGSVEEENIIDKINNSRNQIVILSADYTNHDGENIWTQIEWKHTWNNFKQDSYIKNIIVVNFDQLRRKDFEVGPLKAFLGLSLALDFSNRRHQLFDEIKRLLGIPNSYCAPRNYGWLASKPRYSSQVSCISLENNPKKYLSCKDNFEYHFFNQHTCDKTQNFKFKPSHAKKEIQQQNYGGEKYGIQNNIEQNLSPSIFNGTSNGSLVGNEGSISFTKYRAPEEIDIKV